MISPVVWPTRLPYTELGVQVCGDLDATIGTVAVLPGVGRFLFDEVRAAGVDVYVTSDLRIIR